MSSGGARSPIARSSTTGNDVRASRRIRAKEAQAPPPSPRHTAPSLQRQVGPNGPLTFIIISLQYYYSGPESCLEENIDNSLNDKPVQILKYQIPSNGHQAVNHSTGNVSISK